MTRATSSFWSPLHWKEPKLIFTCSWSDFFIEEADEWRMDAFDVITTTPQHRYLILTKRIERVVDFLRWDEDFIKQHENVCLMTTVENQRQADERIPRLLKIPARWHGVSVEPLLGPVDVSRFLLSPDGFVTSDWSRGPVHRDDGGKGLDWVICGGESGGPEYRSLAEKQDAPTAYQMLSRFYGPSGFDETGSQPEQKTRYMEKPQALAWVRCLRDQCVDAGVPFFFKQWGGPRSTSAGRLLDGREWTEKPEFFAGIAR